MSTSETLLENGQATRKRERGERDECVVQKTKKKCRAPRLFLLFPAPCSQPRLFFFLLPLQPFDFGDVFLVCSGISFLHSKNKIEACDCEVERRGFGRACARVDEMLPAATDSALRGKTSNSGAAPKPKKKKPREQKTKQFLRIYQLTLPLSLSLTLTVPLCSCQESFCAQRNKEFIAKKKCRNRKHNSQVLGRKKKLSSTQLSLSILSLSPSPSLSFVLKLETDT